MNTRLIGKKAELIAEKFLRTRGHKILARNWTCYAGEIDLISFNKFLTFIEVKSIGNTNYCKPYELFSAKKRKNLIRSINTFLLKNKLLRAKWRLDLICINFSGNNSVRLRYFSNITGF